MLKTLATTDEPQAVLEHEPAAELPYDAKAALRDATDYESQLVLLRQVVEKEPKRVAQVVKSWVDRG